MSDKKDELYGIVLRCIPNLKPADYLSALSTIVDPKSVKSFGMIAGNNYGVFFNSAENCENALKQGEIKIKSETVKILPYETAVKNVFIKGVPVLSSLLPLAEFLKRYGALKSEFRRLLLKNVPEGFSHLVSHTLHVKMLMNKDAKPLPAFANIDFGEDTISVKIEYGAKKCFKCGDRNHEVKLCPKNLESFPSIPKPSVEPEKPKPDCTELESQNQSDTPLDSSMDSQDNNEPKSKTTDTEFGWNTIAAGKRQRQSHGSSGHVRPENNAKNLCHEAHSTLKYIENKYSDWKDREIGNQLLKNEDLQKILVSGCFSIENVAKEAVKHTKNASDLIKQLNSLASTINEGRFKNYIRNVCDSIPIRLADLMPANA